MTDERCNGWRNRETWLVSLGFGDWFAEMADEGQKVDADYIEQTVTEYVDETLGSQASASFITDMIDLGCIDWHELAEHDVAEERQ